MKKAKILANNKGFTLIELMVVVIIIGILAAIAIPQFTKQSDKAKVKRAMGEIRSMKAAVDAYYAEKGSMPITGANPTAAGHIEGVLKDNGVKWDTMKDPWGNAYVYEVNGSTYKVYSNGPDGVIDAASTDDILATEAAEVAEASTVGAAGANKDSSGP